MELWEDKRRGRRYVEIIVRAVEKPDGGGKAKRKQLCKFTLDGMGPEDIEMLRAMIKTGAQKLDTREFQPKMEEAPDRPPAPVLPAKSQMGPPPEKEDEEDAMPVEMQPREESALKRIERLGRERIKGEAG